MRKYFKILAFALALTMIYSNTLNVTSAYAAAANPSLKYQTRTVYIGGDVYGTYTDSCQIPVQDAGGYAAEYTVIKGKDLVTVSNKGKVVATGNGVGAATIAVKLTKKNANTVTLNFNVNVRRSATAVRLTSKSSEAIKAPIKVGDKVTLEVAKSYNGSYAKGKYGLDNYRGVVTDSVMIISLTPDIATASGLILTAKKEGTARFEIQTYQYGNKSLVTAKSKTYSIKVEPATQQGTEEDIITFGGYEWIVLEAYEDGSKLVITKDILEMRAYHETWEDITWENCALRKYLNNEFYNSFSTTDRNKIVERKNSNKDNQWYGTKGGNDTYDKIFLLSLEEVVKYFGDSGQLKNGNPNSDYSIHDQYNDARVAEYNGRTWYWFLRSPGQVSISIACVSDDGYIDVIGDGVDILVDDIGVRPALLLNP